MKEFQPPVAMENSSLMLIQPMLCCVTSSVDGGVALREGLNRNRLSLWDPASLLTSLWMDVSTPQIYNLYHLFFSL